MGSTMCKKENNGESFIKFRLEVYHKMIKYKSNLFWKASADALVTPVPQLKDEWNSMGMLKRQYIMSALLFCVPNVLWVTFKQGGLSMVPSILVI